MSNDLNQENKQLRRNMKAFLAQARENEQKMRRFHEQELRLLGAESLAELIQILLYDYRKTFELDAVTLTLIDPEYEIQRILEELGIRLTDYPDLVFVQDSETLDAIFGASGVPRLGLYQAQTHAGLFPHYPNAPASVAVLPLLRRGELIGSLNLGSRAEQRFVTGTATDFLERMAGFVAVCLENATNKERLKHVGLTDALTRVHNRRYFDQRLREEIDRAQRQGRPLSCLFLDIDFFKRINDTYGHHAGDRVLQEVAARIKSHMRMSDILARYGGEEFAALLVQSDHTEALEIAERIRQTVAEEPFALAEVEAAGEPALEVTVSIGVATRYGSDRLTEGEAAAEGLVDQADQALYHAKENGRNRVTYQEQVA
ncbi:MAG TPA: DUF484 family protein [Gammaproteobacteria bacterium]|nr:DUF484 family protein [Gammaproteobacteria bacterium]